MSDEQEIVLVFPYLCIIDIQIKKCQIIHKVFCSQNLIEI